MRQRYINHSATKIIPFLILLSFLLSPAIALADPSVTLAWDANSPTPDGYRIFKRIENQSYDYNNPSWTGTATTGTISNLAYDTTYYFIVRAYVGALESADSEEVSFFAAAPATPTFTISATTAGNGTISPANAVSVDQNDNQTFTISPAAGYDIADVIVDGLSRGAISSYTFSNVTANHTIHATFAIDTYTITASSGSNGSISPSGSASVNHGTGKTYTITPDDGYHIADVAVDGSSRGAISSYTFSNVTANHTIHATFAIDTYTITAFSGSNGSVSPSGSASVNHGTGMTYTITPDDGYHVADVTVDGASRGPVTTFAFTNVVANHTINALFAADGVATFTVTASASAGGAILPAGTLIKDEGSSQSFTIAANPGYEIDDLLVNGQSMGAVGNHLINNISADYTVHALFVASANQAPVADAGPDQTVEETRQVVISGLNSMDADDGIESFQWRQVKGPTVALQSADQAEARFTAPDVNGSGTTLEFELAVTDYSGVTTVDKCVVNVSWMNLAPTADAGGEQTVAEGTSVGLDASRSTDLDDGIAGYLWRQTQGPSVVLLSDQSPLASFQAPKGIAGETLTFELTVTDKGGLEDTDTCLVNITSASSSVVSRPPLADAGGYQQVTPGESVFLDGTGSVDADGNTIVAYRWRQTDGSPVELSDSTADSPSFTAPNLGVDGGDLTFELTVTDRNGLKDKDTCTVSVDPTDQPEDVGETDIPDAPAELTISMDNNTALDHMTVKSSAINCKGQSSGAGLVVWRNSLGDSGVADGTGRWSVKKIKLESGSNTITFTAYDAAGNSKSVSKTIYRE